MDATFRRATPDDIRKYYNGRRSTSLQTYFDTSYARLHEKFGEPDEGDGYKVSTEFDFIEESGNLCTLYDYKETELYGEASVTVETFRARKSYSWHVGAADKRLADAFIRWLIAELG
jgi:hypothetical protein